MHQYGEEGFCLIWAVNNALQEKIVKKEDVVEEIIKMDADNSKRDLHDYIDSTGIDFMDFKRIIRRLYGIELKKVNGISNHGGFIITIDFKSYLHSISSYNGRIMDNRKKRELHHIPWDKVVDIYKVSLSESA
jgi:hypothetical protein